MGLPAHQPGGCLSAETNSTAALDVPGLTARMRRGEEAAYRDFFDAYYNRLLRYLLVVAAGDEASAAEALQSTLLRVVRHIKVFAAEEVFWSWLTVLARSAYVTFGAVDAKVSDNYFDLIPGQPAEIEVTSAATIEQLQAAINANPLTTTQAGQQIITLTGALVVANLQQ